MWLSQPRFPETRAELLLAPNSLLVDVCAPLLDSSSTIGFTIVGSLISCVDRKPERLLRNKSCPGVGGKKKKKKAVQGSGPVQKPDRRPKFPPIKPLSENHIKICIFVKSKSVNRCAVTGK